MPSGRQHIEALNLFSSLYHYRHHHSEEILENPVKEMPKPASNQRTIA